MSSQLIQSESRGLTEVFRIPASIIAGKTMTACYIGVDVGTKSVRAAVVNQNGKVVAKATKDIHIWNPDEDFYVQSSENIWEAVIHAVKVVYIHMYV